MRRESEALAERWNGGFLAIVLHGFAVSRRVRTDGTSVSATVALATHRAHHHYCSHQIQDSIRCNPVSTRSRNAPKIGIIASPSCNAGLIGGLSAHARRLVRGHLPLSVILYVDL
jgi:hypothetical protein